MGSPKFQSLHTLYTCERIISPPAIQTRTQKPSIRSTPLATRVRCMLPLGVKDAEVAVAGTGEYDAARPVVCGGFASGRRALKISSTWCAFMRLKYGDPARYMPWGGEVAGQRSPGPN